MAKGENQDKEEQTGQPKGILDGKKESAKEKVDNTKKKVQKIKKVIEFLKRHPLIAKMLFWVILAIIVIVLFTMIIYAVLGTKEAEPSIALDSVISNMQKIDKEVQDGEEEDENASNTQKMTAGTIREEDGKYFYELLYGEDSEEKNKERINKVKAELAKKNIEIYDNHCLLFLAVMQENGLEITDYKKQDLEAMYMFLKAEIATSSLDLGTEGETLENQIVPEEKTYLKENYDENDFSNDRINGTIKVQRVKYDQKKEAEEIGVKTQLKYMPLEKFENLIDAHDKTALNYFTLDEDNNLLVAGWRDTSITYDVTNYNIDGVENNEEEEKLQEYYNGDDFEHGESSVYKYRSIPYLNYISKYTMPFSFLMTLLATTNDVDFCKDLTKVAEQSSMTITLHEEYSKSTTTITNEHNETQKVYANINADVGGTTTQNENWSYETLPSNFNANTILNNNHWKDGKNKNTTGGGNVNNYYQTYTWEYENIKYELHISGRQNGLDMSSCYFRHKTTNLEPKTGNITNIFITKDKKLQGTMPEEVGKFRDIAEENYIDHIDLFEGLQNYTVLRNKSYTLLTTIINESNSYLMEITEVDNWYEYYQKTYSEVKYEELSQPENNAEEDIMPQVYTTTITDADEIKNMKYVKEISQEEKNRLITKAIGTEDFEDPKFDVTQIQESIFSYGKENIKTNHTVKKYKRAGTEKELVQVKVQKDNEKALLNIAADAFGAQNKIDEEDKENDNENNKKDDEEKKKEEIYETTSEKTNSFLYVYDKYENVQRTFHSIDEWAYEMLEKRSSCKGMTNLLRYLIFLYDGTDLGITEYDLTLLKPDEFKKVIRGKSAIVEWLRSYENNWLREYRNGTASTAYVNYVFDQKYARENPDTGEIEYGLELLNLKNDHSLNYSYGLRVYEYSSNSVSSLYRGYFNDEGMDLDALVNEYLNGSGQGWANADAVDRIQLRYVNDQKQEIVEAYEAAGVNLDSNEVDALLACSYAFGADGAGIYWNSNIELVKQYKEGTIDVNTLFNNFHGSRGYPFVYSTSPARGEAHRVMFSEGRYILSTGEELDLTEFLEGDFLGVAIRLHKKMEEEQWAYYTDTNEPLYYEDIEASTTKTKATCCATYVASSLYLAGVCTEEEINRVGYNNCGGLIDLFQSKGYQVISSSSDLEAGDVVFLSYPDTTYQYDHVEIYAGDGTWLGAGSTRSIRMQSPSSANHTLCMSNFKVAYRLVQ